MVGLALGVPVNISNTSGHSSPAALAADRNYVHVVWADNTSGNSEDSYTAEGTDGGVSFGGAVNISNTTGYSSQPAVVCLLRKMCMLCGLIIVWETSISYTEELVLMVGLALESNCEYKQH